MKNRTKDDLKEFRRQPGRKLKWEERENWAFVVQKKQSLMRVGIQAREIQFIVTEHFWCVNVIYFTAAPHQFSFSVVSC